MASGHVVGGRFELLERLGTGGAGLVHKALDRTNGRTVALKELHGLTPDAEARFARECALLASVDEPGIVRYIAHGTGGGDTSWLAMEWVMGPTLSSVLKNQGLSLDKSLALIERVAGAAGALHKRGIVHRDIKPSNILLEDGDPTRPKLIDFGIARAEVGSDALTATGVIVGTVGYMAPEQAAGRPDIDARADVFALGCLLFKCITGQAPWTGDEPLAVMLRITLEDAPRLASIERRVPRELDELVARLLERDRERRPKNGDEVVSMLAEIVDFEPVSSRPSVPDVGAVTTTERRLVFLVLARRPGKAPEPAPGWQKSVAAALYLLNLTADILVDGTLFVVVSGANIAPNELARRAARAALTVRAAVPDALGVVTTGRTAETGGALLSEAIARASSLLSTLEPEGKPGDIALCATTARLVGDRFDLQPRQDGALLVTERSEGSLGGGDVTTPYVGRDRELAFVEGLVRESFLEGQARAVLVVGAPGSGKSRLARELIVRLEGWGAATWVAQGDALASSTPLGMLAPLLFRLADVVRGESSSASAGKIAVLVKRFVEGDEATRIAEFLGEMVGVRSPGLDSRALAAARRDATLMGDQMRRALTGFIGAVCRRQPVLLLLEDIESADSATLTFIDAVLRGLEASPLAVVCLARPEVKTTFPLLFAERGLHEVRLDPLSRAAASKLARALIGRDASEATIERLVEKAGGNPFFLEELVRASTQRELEALPESVLAVLEARLEALAPSSRRVLRAASVFGKSFWEGGLAALVPSVDIRRELETLEAADIVRRAPESRFELEPEWGFRHGLMAEAAYARLPLADRARAHLAAAGWLKTTGEGDPTLLAEHFERGGDAGSAVGLLSEAAHLALEASNLEQAVSLGERALRCGASGEARGSLFADIAEARLWRGQNQEVIAASREAMATLPSGSPAWCRAATSAVAAAGRANDRAAADRALQEVLALDPKGDGLPERSMLLAQTAIQLVFVGRLDTADRILRRLPSAAIESEPGRLAWILRARAWRALSDGDPCAYGGLMQLSAASFGALGDLRNACVQKVNVAYAAMNLGQLESAETDLREVFHEASLLGLDMVAAVACHNLGLVLSWLGRADEGAELEREAIASFEAQKDARMLAASHGYLARILRRAGDAEGAEAAARTGVALAPQNSPIQAITLATLAFVLLDSADDSAEGEALCQEARIVAGRALRLLSEMGGVDEGEGLVRLVYAEALALSGLPESHEAADDAAARLLARAERITPASVRASFLERVPEHARTLSLQEWLSHFVLDEPTEPGQPSEPEEPTEPDRPRGS